MSATTTAPIRVIASTRIGFADPQVSVIWEGTSVEKLSKQYPPSNVMFADPLDRKEIEGGHIITGYHFEQQLEDGSWQTINDPRVRITPVTEYERAIDAENRRDFPGDYIDECHRCGSDPCVCYDNSVDCTKCGDYGCALCDLDWCKNCDNYGCSTCQPEEYSCTSCQDHGCPDCDPHFYKCSDCRDYGCKECEPSHVCNVCGEHDHSVNNQQKCMYCIQEEEYSASLCINCTIDQHDGKADRSCPNCRYYCRVYGRFGYFWRLHYWLRDRF